MFRPQYTKEVSRGVERHGAVETVLQSGSLYGSEFAMLSRTRLSFPTSQLPFGIAFVLTNRSNVSYHYHSYYVIMVDVVRSSHHYQSLLSLMTHSSPADIYLLQSMWIKNHGEDFMIMFSGELKAGISKHRLLMPSSTASLFSTQILRRTAEFGSPDSAVESHSEDTSAPVRFDFHPICFPLLFLFALKLALC